MSTPSTARYSDANFQYLGTLEALAEDFLFTSLCCLGVTLRFGRKNLVRKRINH